MNNKHDQVNQLHAKLDLLTRKQAAFSQEINDLRLEIQRIKVPHEKATAKIKKNESFTDSMNLQTEKQAPQIQEKRIEIPKKKIPTIRFDTEKFIGENLINKIGIVIMLIGLGIGTKYSIEHELISPLTRIILAYLAGFGLLGLGFKLRTKYENYSAVLVGGAMAVMYFVSFAAYNFYDLIPQFVAFALMLLFTAFTVFAALKYKQQAIALIGMVGAYAVPFLLSDGSGNVGVLFTYMAIINVGILIIALQQYWKALYLSSYALSWLIFIVWFAFDYSRSEHFGLALSFSILFFFTFYSVFLAYKLLRKEAFEKLDLILLLSNTFIFYAVGYALLNHHETGEDFLGFFTLCNAFVHAIVSYIFYKQKHADKNLFYLASGLSLIFISISIPVQLDGNWVTLLWTGEAALLFWIGRTKQLTVYEKMAYPLMLVALFSMIHDWSSVHYQLDSDKSMIPLINVNFLSSVLFVTAFAFINRLNVKTNCALPFRKDGSLQQFFNIVMPAILIGSVYFTFSVEISAYFEQLYINSQITINESYIKVSDTNILKYKQVWLINYSILFFSLLSFFNIKTLKNLKLSNVNLALNVLCLWFFLSQGLYVLSELRDNYLTQDLNAHYHIGGFAVVIRYISYMFVAVLLFAIYKSIKQSFFKMKLSMAYDILMFISILWLISSEFINLMTLGDSSQSDKLGLSILWGIYALLFVVWGIWKQKKHLRLGAIGLFGITLLKLFFYDISHLETLHKTIVFVSLGILLLAISFIYNKYKNLISDDISLKKSE